MNNTMATGNKYTKMYLCVCTNVSIFMKANKKKSTFLYFVNIE